MTEERRLELIKLINQKAEEARISIRQRREKIVDDLNERKKKNTISENEFFQEKDKIQKIVDEYVEKADQIRSKKENEIKNL